MKRILVLFLALLFLAIPVSAENYLIHDDAGLLKDHDVQKLEQVYGDFAAANGFTVALATVDSFGGLPADEFAGQLYDILAYPEDGILLLVSIELGQWYILTNGECHDRISDGDAAELGESILPLIRDGQYYAAFLAFPEKALEIYQANEPAQTTPVIEEVPEEEKEPFGKTFAICMLIGMALGGVAVLVMVVQMKSVRPRHEAADYIIPGSTRLTNSRDIFLYSHVTRRAKPKNNGSSGGGRSGGSRGGAGGRI